MSLLNRLLPAASPRAAIQAPVIPVGGNGEQRLLTESAFVPPPQLGIIEDYAGMYRSMQHMAVYACVRLLADTIASLPWNVYRREKDGVPKPLDPTPSMIRQPYPGFNLFQWKWMVTATLALRGNSYHYVTARDNLGHPTGIMPLHPDMLFVERKDSPIEWMNPLYRVMGEQVPAHDIIHIRRFTIPGEPVGLSPIRQAATSIGMGLAAEEYGYRYFRDSANPSSVLETDQTLEDDTIRQVQKQWISSHGGRRRPAVLSGGFTWRPIAITPNESQFLETRQFQTSEIAMMFGIPGHMIGAEGKGTVWGTGIEQMSLGFVTYTLRPWLNCIESALSDVLPGAQFVRFDTTDLLRGDHKARAEYYKLMRETGVLNVNEIRKEQEYEPIGPEGDIYLQPVNMAPLGFDPAKTAKNATADAGSKVPGKVSIKEEDDKDEPNGGGTADGPPESSEDSGRTRAATNGHTV